ncbi:MAG: PhoH family protein [Lachnospiraceae bacterium]|nr:PhoH family protein [Ruminococcus sp.]MCM1276073.1 PhoH family protein [Lachnospiraceae bacterium]
MADITITMSGTDEIRAVFGEFDRNINLIQKAFSVTIFARGGEVRITGDDETAVAKAEKAVKTLCESFSRGETIEEQNVRYAIAMVNDGAEGEIAAISGDCVCVSCSGKPIKPKTVGQKKYCDMIRKNTITFGVGPAGTGKTYLAVALAVTAFKQKQVQRIILTRPAVEAGEKLGFLPGDLQNKVDPYLRPLYDALFEMFGQEAFARLSEHGAIEVAPLAYMRGRTLDDSFIILDEAQNTTREQMKMFLTRLGFNSKMVITGDITQIDLPEAKKSGLIEALKVLRNVEDIAQNRFTEKDVVRHKLVQDIVKAYDEYQGTARKDKGAWKN